MENRNLLSLDGLRGIAALIVVAGHIETFVVGKEQFISAYGLCVDFFFILSGFVIARSYEAKFSAGMGFVRYARIRVVRVYPLMALGIALGFILLPSQSHELTRLGSQLLFVPTFWLVGSFALNSIQWSLVVELVVNFVHFFVARWLTLVRIVILACLFAMILFFLARVYGSLRFGWNSSTFFGGLARGGFGFTAGILLFRVPSRYAVRLHWCMVAAALPIVVLLASWKPIAEHWFSESIIVVLILPALCWAAIHCRLPKSVVPFAEMLGAMSYPIYALHFPLLIAAGAVAAALGWSVLSFCVIWTPAMLLISWLALQCVDIPVRNWLALPRSRPRVRPVLAL